MVNKGNLLNLHVYARFPGGGKGVDGQKSMRSVPKCQFIAKYALLQRISRLYMRPRLRGRLIRQNEKH
jgi:hypothetical protein